MADMSIHDGKTKVMHTQKTIVVPTPKPEEYSTAEVKVLLKFECEACGMAYPTKAGLNIHQARYCDMHARQEKMDYPVEKVLDSRGPIGQRFYFLKYEGYGPEYNKWSSARWCNCSKKIAEFWQSKGMCEADIIPEGPNPHMGKTQGYTHRQAGMRLDYKNSAHSENCSVLANRIVRNTSFSRSVRTSGQSAAWFGSAHEESDAQICRDRFEAPQNRHRLA